MRVDYCLLLNHPFREGCNPFLIDVFKGHGTSLGDDGHVDGQLHDLAIAREGYILYKIAIAFSIMRRRRRRRRRRNFREKVFFQEEGLDQ
tara:strand:- start:152 stop:421 length:270 start_codon:yes stop_codon:yes gene_type:complete